MLLYLKNNKLYQYSYQAIQHASGTFKSPRQQNYNFLNGQLFYQIYAELILR